MYNVATGTFHSVTVRNAYKPRTVSFRNLNGWREDGSRNFGFTRTATAERFLEACGYVRTDMNGSESLTNGVHVYSLWRHRNGTYATLSEITTYPHA